MADGGETAATEPRLVVADGDVLATVSGIWSDVDGVRVSIDWAADVFNGITALEDMSAAQATALADVLRGVAGMSPPVLP